MFVIIMSILRPEPNCEEIILENVRMLPLREGEVVICDPESIEYTYDGDDEKLNYDGIYMFMIEPAFNVLMTPYVIV